MFTLLTKALFISCTGAERRRVGWTKEWVAVIRFFSFLDQPDLVQGIPGVIAGSEEGVGAGALDLRTELGAVGVTLGGAGFDHAQGAVHIVNGSHWERDKRMRNHQNQ